MLVRDVMTKQVATCRADTNLAEAIALMWQTDCGALPVVAADGKLTGIVTDRDICIALGTRNLRSSELNIGEVFQDHVLFCRASDHVHTALQKMSKAKVRRLPVLDDDSRLAGILSIDDIVLSAQADDRRGTAISYRDAVDALQNIYCRQRSTLSEPAAA